MHNGLEMQYILRLRSHDEIYEVIWAYFYTSLNSHQIFSITIIQFAWLIFIQLLNGYFFCAVSNPRLVFIKPEKPPQKCLLCSKSFALPTKTNSCKVLLCIHYDAVRLFNIQRALYVTQSVEKNPHQFLTTKFAYIPSRDIKFSSFKNQKKCCTHWK